MDRACLTFPILPGRTEAALGLMRALDGNHRAEYEAALGRLGITTHVWFLASGPGGDELVAYIESADWVDAFDGLARSRRPFDRWLKASIAEVTGTDLDDLPLGVIQPRLLSCYTR